MPAARGDEPDLMMTECTRRVHRLALEPGGNQPEEAEPGIRGSLPLATPKPTVETVNVTCPPGTSAHVHVPWMLLQVPLLKPRDAKNHILYAEENNAERGAFPLLSCSSPLCLHSGGKHLSHPPELFM